MKHHVPFDIRAYEFIVFDKLQLEYRLSVHLALDGFGEAESGKIPYGKISVLVAAHHKQVVLRDGKTVD